MTLACVVATMNTIIMGLPVQRELAVAVVTAAVVYGSGSCDPDSLLCDGCGDETSCSGDCTWDGSACS